MDQEFCWFSKSPSTSPCSVSQFSSTVMQICLSWKLAWEEVHPYHQTQQQLLQSLCYQHAHNEKWSVCQHLLDWSEALVQCHVHGGHLIDDTNHCATNSVLPCRQSTCTCRYHIWVKNWMSDVLFFVDARNFLHCTTSCLLWIFLNSTVPDVDWRSCVSGSFIEVSV